MKYGKLENGLLKLPPAKLKNVPRTFQPAEPDGELISGLYDVGYDPNIDPEPDVVAYLLDLGYLPVVETQRPDDGEGYHYEADYSMGDGEIVQVWTLAEDELPDPNPEIDAERALAIILTGRDIYET